MFENLDKQILEIEYDVYCKKMGEHIKNISEEKFFEERKKYRSNLESLININKNSINLQELKNNFADILLLENSSEILWMLNSIYIDEECTTSYLDTVSDIFKKMNKVVRKGVNTYKANGWMTHTLYVYQIINKNIARGIFPNNFKNDIEKEKFIRECFNELHKVYLTFDSTLKFILKITSLIHDIGVAKSVKDHGYHGQEFVENILKDVGITEEFLAKNNIEITLENLIVLEKAILKEHTIYTGVSSEFSDYFVKEQFKTLLGKIEKVGLDKKKTTLMLYMFTVADVIGVDESIFDKQKLKLLNESKTFFMEIIENKKQSRDKESIAIQRICDFVGIYDEEKIKQKSEQAMKKYNIDSKMFWNRMYEAGQFWFFLSIMKEIGSNFENVIRTLNSIFEVTYAKFGEDKIKTLSVVWIPNNTQKQAVENMKNDTFFLAMNLLEKSENNSIEYEKNKLTTYEKDGRVYFEIEIL